MIIHEKPFLTPGKLNMLLIITFLLGTLTLIALSIGAIIVLASLFNLLLDSLTEVSVHLSTLYTQSDSLVKLLMWCIALLVLVKCSPLAARCIRPLIVRL